MWPPVLTRRRRRPRSRIEAARAPRFKNERGSPLSVVAAVAAVLQVPRVLHAIRAGAARGRHAWLVRDEAAVGGAAARAGILHAPGAIDLGGTGAGIEQAERAEGEEGKADAERGHGESPG